MDIRDDPRSDYFEALSVKAPQTGEWLIHHDVIFKKWRNPDLNAPTTILWLHGFPGSGKTILSATVINHLELSLQCFEPRPALAYFFFRSDTASKQAVSEFLLAILAQLLDNLDPRMRSQMVRGEAPPPWSSIEVLFDYLVKILSMFREAFLVIDALYECRVDEQRALFRIIRKLSETNRGFVLHIFVTSRTTIEILDEMRLLNALEIQIGGRETDVDIRIFIESEIHNNVQLKRLPRALVEEMVSTLLQNSHGMILYAALALRSLRHFPGLTVKRVRESLNRTPRGLSELYRSLLYGIHDDCKPFAIAVITWLCTSFEPMPITALWEAISFNPKASADDELLIDPEELPLLLNGLARVINDKILLIHPTAAEELRRIRYEVGQSISEFGVYEKDAQLSLASTCLRYIVHYTESERRLNSTQDFEAFPLLKYACRFWMGHTRRWAEVSRLDEGAENGELGVLVKSILSSAESIEAWTSIFDPEDPERDAFGPRRTGAPASPVFYAIKSGINEAVAGVLQGGADASARTRDGRRPLHVAVMERNMPMVSMLLDHGASTTATDSNGEMPLLEAAYSGQEDLTALLCQHTESREVIQENSEGLSILHRLAQDPEATGPIFLLFLEPRSTSHQSRILLESLLNVRDRELCTPLHHAVKAENIAVATVLLQQGADINAKNKNGDTPLHFAAEFDPRGSWELLIDYGAVVTVENNKQLTPLTATWSKKSLPWSSYMEDTELSRGMTHNTKVLKKVPNSPGPALPQHIFRKVYNLDREKNEDLKFVVTSLACENRLFQRLDHPHIVSYLGCEAFGTNEPKLYLEYCNGGDPGYYVEPLTPTEISHNHKLPTSQEDEEHEELGNLKWGKMEVWRLIYQLFAALAHLHYGVSISGREKDCRYELGWDPAFHCDIKPNNVVLKETNGECEAKICDLGTAGDLITGPKSRSGTKGWRPPELDTMKRRNWSTKGDVWALGKTIAKLHKNFSPDEVMTKILTECKDPDPDLRPSSLKVLETSHPHVDIQFPSLRKELDRAKPNTLTYHAFLQVTKEMDTTIPFNTDAAIDKRERLLYRLRMLLQDGARDEFKKTCESLHLAVLMEDEIPGPVQNSTDPADQNLLEKLLERGLHPDKQLPKSGWTALHLAAQQGKGEAVTQLLKMNANTAILDSHGWSALQYVTKCHQLWEARENREKDNPKMNMNINRKKGKNSQPSSMFQNTKIDRFRKMKDNLRAIEKAIRKYMEDPTGYPGDRGNELQEGIQEG